MEKLNNYCFKCSSTELLLLGGSDIFCTVCLLVFQDKETHEFLEFKEPHPVESIFHSMGSWNFSNMLRVFYAWLVRINRLFKIDEFFIEVNYVEIDREFKKDPVIVKSKTITSHLDYVINTLYNNTLKNNNSEHYNFIDMSLSKNQKLDVVRRIDFTVYCNYKNVRYDIARFGVFDENYSKSNLYFEDWEMLFIDSDSYFSDTPFKKLKKSYNRF